MTTIATLSLNAAALALIGSATKFRVDVRDGALFLRPTDRKASPDLVDISVKGNNTATFALEMERLAGKGLTLEKDNKFIVAQDKYGWLAVRQANEGEDVKSTVRVTGLKVVPDPVPVEKPVAEKGTKAKKVSAGTEAPPEAAPQEAPVPEAVSETVPETPAPDAAEVTQ